MLGKALVTILMGLALATVAAPVMAAQNDKDRPGIENAQFEERALTRQLPTEVKSWAGQAAQAQWLGYSVPQVAGERNVCCGNFNGNWNDGCGNCRLEDRDTGNSVNMSSGGTAKLEGPRTIAVLFRA